MRERVPDRVVAAADEVVNIDLTADELITRLREGKIYTPDKVEAALRNFFQPEHICNCANWPSKRWPRKWNAK